MKVICSKRNLLDGINIVQKAVSGKTTLQILEGIFIEADENIKMTGNDLEIGIECYVEADVEIKGSIVLNARIFGDIVRKLPEADIMINVKENNLVIIECENSKFEIKGLPVDGFPALPSIETENYFEIKQSTIREMIRQTIFAVSFDENRPILTGSLVEYRNGELIFVSIDGFRLALRKRAVDEKSPDLHVVVPGKTLNEISKIMQPIEDKIKIYSTKNQILFDMGKCKVVSRLLDGEYLNYSSIIPEDFETKIKINVKKMLSSLERASLIINIEERRYPVKFKIKDESIVITSNTDVGAVKEEISVEMTGNDNEISFNPRYFIEALKIIDDEYVNIMFISNVGPCVIKPVDKETYVYMILPVRS